MHACNKSLQELDLRQRIEATIIAVVRSGKSYPSPSADFVIQPNDIVVVIAAHQNLERAFLFLEKGLIWVDRLIYEREFPNISFMGPRDMLIMNLESMVISVLHELSDG